MSDPELMETSLVALGDGYEGMAADLFERFIADHPQYAGAFINPEAARERMTRETLEALLGLSSDEWWVPTTVVNFVDLHRNFGTFSERDYADWLALVIEAMARRAGTSWPEGATAAWERQAKALTHMVGLELSHSRAPAATKA
jgi:hypothetical protein